MMASPAKKQKQKTKNNPTISAKLEASQNTQYLKKNTISNWTVQNKLTILYDLPFFKLQTDRKAVTMQEDNEKIKQLSFRLLSS